MLVLLYVAVAWVAVDVVLVLAWHYAHVTSRRGRAGLSSSATVRPHTFILVPPAAHSAGHSPTAARPDYLRLIDA